MLVGSEYLKTLTRYGLDARILQDYKTYGIISVSHRNALGNADISKFVDYEGVDRSIIHKVRALENICNIEVFHVIWNSSSEIVFMYHDKANKLNTQLELFKQGTCNALKYNLRKDSVDYCCINYDVVLGAIVDIDYNKNM